MESKKKILIVDDELQIRKMLIKILNREGYELDEAIDGAETLRKAEEASPDLILMDLIMPGLDGFEATRRIRRMPHLEKTRIIALSASVYEESRESSLEAGCDDFVSKPVDIDLLLKKIGQHLGIEPLYEGEARIAKKLDNQEPISAPPPTDLEPLYDAARKGDINEFLDQLAELDEQGEEYSKFIGQLRQLAKRYQMKQIREILESRLHTRS